jgi:hypothetical protein
MLLQDEGAMLNRSTFSKFGIEVGQAVIVFHKLPAEAGQASVTAEGAVLAAAE